MPFNFNLSGSEYTLTGIDSSHVEVDGVTALDAEWEQFAQAYCNGLIMSLAGQYVPDETWLEIAMAKKLDAKPPSMAKDANDKDAIF